MHATHTVYVLIYSVRIYSDNGGLEDGKKVQKYAAKNWGGISQLNYTT
jgi:hypothetical protein